MNMLKMLLSTLAACLILAACGGGGGGGAGESAATVQTPHQLSGNGPFTPGPPTAGDTYTYSQVITTNGITTPYHNSRQYTATDKRVVTYQGASNETLQYQLDADYGTTSSASLDGTNTCTYSPRSIVDKPPYIVGQTFDNTFTATCTSNGFTSVTTNRIVGSATAAESIRVRAGTFYTMKTVYETTGSVTTPANGPSQTVQQTCWRDMVTGQTVKCDANMSSKANPSAQPITSTGTTELIGYTSATAPGGTPNLARFSGQWRGSFAGDDTGTCTSVTVGTNGVITGTCSAASVGTFQVSGTVANDGTASFATGNATTGASFSGSITSIFSASGTWTNTNGAKGTWTLRHL